MRHLLPAAAFAAVIVVAPEVLDRIVPSAPTFLVAPLLPGLYASALLERAGVIQAMNSSGDFTVPATVVMYFASFLAWCLAAWAIAATIRHASRARVG